MLAAQETNETESLHRERDPSEVFQDAPGVASIATPESTWLPDWRCGERCEAVYSFARSWTKQIELGGRFLDGNSDEDFLNIAGKFERSDEWHTLEYDWGGYWGQADGDRTTNRWFANSTADFNKRGRWLFYMTTKNEYDEFENLDYRGSLSAGPGYRLFNEKRKKVVIRAGPAVTYEVFRDPSRRNVTPDLFGEIQIEWPLFEGVDFENKSTYLMSMEDTDIVRIVNSGGISICLNDDESWKLKLGLRHEYNSKPNAGRVPNDFISSVTLVYRRK